MERRHVELLIPPLAYLARAIVGIALIAAGTVKAIHPGTFVSDIWSYRLLPEDWAPWIAAFLPWLEIVAGAALVTNRQRDGARVIAALLLVVFLAALTQAWARELDIACGCFGGAAPVNAGGANYAWLITRDLLLLGCLVFDRWVRRRTVCTKAA